MIDSCVDRRRTGDDENASEELLMNEVCALSSHTSLFYPEYHLQSPCGPKKMGRYHPPRLVTTSAIFVSGAMYDWIFSLIFVLCSKA